MITISIRRALLAVSGCLALSATTVGAATAAPDPGPKSTTKPVTYLGHRFTVPADWPVIDLAADPSACVRFDRHAVYLGTPGDGASCPAHAVGRTEALLVEPASADAATGATTDPADHELTATAAGIRVTGTYDLDEGLVRGIIAGAGLSKGKAAFAESPAAQSPAATAVAALPADSTDFTGKGFDTCTAPTSDFMKAWKANSPYGAVGIYIGGSTRSCLQPNLTADWMRQQASDGWRFIPIYGGPQAAKITNPTAEGVREADYAIANAAALGLGPGSVLYYDMEHYTNPQYGSTVAGFASAWTNRLHERGYRSGVYSSSSSGIADIVRNRNNGYTVPDVLYSALWNGVANTTDPAIPGDLWANHQRIHQYSGDVIETWGGLSRKVDRDYLDVAPSATPNPQPNPIDPARVDFNGDGKRDVAGRAPDGALLLWTGNGNGQLDPTSGHAMWPDTGFAQVSDMVAADFNGDGKTDVAGKLPDGNLLLWSGKGNGTLDPATGYSMWPDNGFKDVSGLVAGDFNGDGKADIAGKLSDGNLLLWTGNGNGTLNTQSGYGMWPDNGFKDVDNLVAGDFNGDGKTDIAGRASGGALLLWTGNGNGTLNTQSGYGMWPDNGFKDVDNL
ncbi:glycoside hydrolase domain-containing protein, partial [Kitasatospora sp. NPDC093806]|uniref:glycoside hydrolase domain-containing protein n=1 Tax=Kitasatospora sp. NPDC093806 TaxID=3155075 RepID=UPI0034178920